MVKKKLIIDARMINGSGIGIYLRNVIDSLTGFNITLIGKQSELRSYEAKMRLIHFDAHIYSIKALMLLPLIIPRCDIYWSPHFNAPWLPVRAHKRVVTIHDLYHVSNESSLPWYQKVYADIMIRRALMSDKIITVSYFTKSEIIRSYKVDEKKIHVIHNGIDPRRFNVKKTRSDSVVPGEFNITKDYVLTVGNVKPHKNLSTLLKGFDLAVEQKPDIQLVIVGKQDGFLNSDNLSSTLSEMKHADKVVFTGFVPDDSLTSLYKGASLFVFPSLYEGFGLPPLEAQACGIPVLVSDIESLREVCSDSAHYFDPKSVEDLSESIIRLLNLEGNLKNKMIHLGIENVRKFTWDNSRQKHQALFESLIED